MTVEPSETPSEPLPRDEFRDRLFSYRDQYYDNHPFHQRMHDGALTRDALRCWVRNRYYYQKMIPIKDAYFLANCPLRDIRAQWVERILVHDGYGDRPGGIEKWLRLGESVGLSRSRMEDSYLPGVQFAVDAYVNFVRDHTWLESMAASLTELFAPDLMQRRIRVLEEKYDWIDDEGLAYFRDRVEQAPRDTDYTLDLVLEHCEQRSQQESALAALEFKCDVLWSLLDSIQHQGDY